MITEDKKVQEITIFNDYTQMVTLNVEPDGKLVKGETKTNDSWVTNYFIADKDGEYFSVANNESLFYTKGDLILSMAARNKETDEVRSFDFIIQAPIITDTILNFLNERKMKEETTEQKYEDQVMNDIDALNEWVTLQNNIEQGPKKEDNVEKLQSHILSHRDEYPIYTPMDYNNYLLKVNPDRTADKIYRAQAMSDINEIMFIPEDGILATKDYGDIAVFKGDIFVSFYNNRHSKNAGLDDFVVFSSIKDFLDYIQYRDRITEEAKRQEELNKCSTNTCCGKCGELDVCDEPMVSDGPIPITLKNHINEVL